MGTQFEQQSFFYLCEARSQRTLCPTAQRWSSNFAEPCCKPLQLHGNTTDFLEQERIISAKFNSMFLEMHATIQPLSLPPPASLYGSSKMLPEMLFPLMLRCVLGTVFASDLMLQGLHR